MRTIVTTKSQTVFDLAVQEYGNAEAAFQIVSDNPHLAGLNDFPAGYEKQEEADFDISHPIKEGVKVFLQDYIESENRLIANELNSVVS